MKLEQTLLPSPIQASVRPASGPRRSSKVIRSAMIWHGWLASERPLITGTLDAAASARTSSWALARIMIASTMRESTRAVSSTVSPRPSCMSLCVAMIEAPPSCRIAASNENQVRVEFFWKIIASTRSRPGASGSTRPFGQPARAALRALASSRIARRSAASISQRSRKWRTFVTAFPPSSRLGAYAPRLATLPPACGGKSDPLLPSCNEGRCRWTSERQRARRDGGEKSRGRLGPRRLAGALQLLHRLAGFLAGDQQRGQQAHAVVAAAGDQQALVAGETHEVAVVGVKLEADQEALAADLGHDVRVAILEAGELLRKIAGDVAHVGEGLGPGQLLDGGEADRHRERIAAVGRAVRADGHALASFGGGEARADREAVAERFRQAH